MSCSVFFVVLLYVRAGLADVWCCSLCEGRAYDVAPVPLECAAFVNWPLPDTELEFYDPVLCCRMWLHSLLLSGLSIGILIAFLSM